MVTALVITLSDATEYFTSAGGQLHLTTNTWTLICDKGKKTLRKKTAEL